MKKYVVSLLLVCSLFIILAGCGSSESSGGSDAEDKKVLTVVTNAEYAPMEYMSKGELAGFDIDFINAVAEEAGYTADIQHVGWDPMFVEVESGRAQVGASAISISEERKEIYEFSVPYFLSTNKILVPEGSSIKSSADLEGKKVAVLTGSTGMIAVEKVLGVNNKNIKKFESNVLAIQELKQNGADAVVADGAVVDEYVKNNPNDNFVVIEDQANFDSEFYGLITAKGNTELKAELDEAINTLFENGKYEEIYEDWFGNKPDIEYLKAQQ